VRKTLLLVAMFLTTMMDVAAFEFDIEGRVAYFYPQNKDLRKFYGRDGWAEYQLVVATPLNLCCLDCNWAVWADFGYFERKGHSRTDCVGEEHHGTRLRHYDFNVGILRYFPLCDCGWDHLRPYLGVGGGAARAQFHDKSEFFHQHVKRWGASVVVRSGIQYEILCNVFLDGFVDYTWNHFSKQHSSDCIETKSFTTGGLQVGLGLGYRF